MACQSFSSVTIEFSECTSARRFLVLRYSAPSRRTGAPGHFYERLGTERRPSPCDNKLGRTRTSKSEFGHTHSNCGCAECRSWRSDHQSQKRNPKEIGRKYPSSCYSSTAHDLTGSQAAQF